MSAQAKLLTAVAMLCVIGGGLAAYKSQKLSVPFWEDERVDEWLVEAKLSFVATGRDVDASLALPSSLIDQQAGQESGSLGYDFDIRTDRGRVHRPVVGK